MMGIATRIRERVSKMRDERRVLKAQEQMYKERSERSGAAMRLDRLKDERERLLLREQVRQAERENRLLASAPRRERVERFKKGAGEALAALKQRQKVNSQQSKSRRKKAVQATVKRFGSESTSPFSPRNAAPQGSGPSGSDKTRDIFGMGKKKNVFYD